MENERQARVEEQVKWMAPRIERIENKLDHVISKMENRWGQIIGACGIVSFLTAVAVEIFRR